MTLQQVNALEAARHTYRDFEDYARLLQQRLCNALMWHIENCDHVFPDGSPAIRGGMFCNTCQICGWTDL